MSSKIEWLNGGDTWNPIIARVRPDAAEIAIAKGYTSLVQIAEKQAGKRGHHCEHAHAGCNHCYAEAMNGRCLTAWGTGLPYDRRSRDLLTFEIHEETLVQPLKWRKPRSIFPCSMTDLFGDWVPDEFIDRVFAVMALCSQHRFIVLTKRAQRMAEYTGNRKKSGKHWESAARAIGYTFKFSGLDGREHSTCPFPLPNVIPGTSASDQGTYDTAAPHMRALAAAGWHTVWSLDPLLGPITLSDVEGREEHGVDLTREAGSKVGGCVGYTPPVSWVIVGGESGHGARPCDVDWIRSIIRQCKASGVSCFVKQLGADPYEERIEYGVGPWGPAKEGIAEDRLKLKNRKGGDMAEWPEDLRVREMPEVLR